MSDDYIDLEGLPEKAKQFIYDCATAVMYPCVGGPCDGSQMGQIGNDIEARWPAFVMRGCTSHRYILMEGVFRYVGPVKVE